MLSTEVIFVKDGNDRLTNSEYMCRVGQLLFVLNRFEPRARTRVSLVRSDDEEGEGCEDSDSDREGGGGAGRRQAKRKALRRDSSDSVDKLHRVEGVTLRGRRSTSRQVNVCLF